MFTRGADRVDVDGAIDGDLIAMAERIVRGQIIGSPCVLPRARSRAGGGVVHAIAESTRIEGTVRDDVYGLVESLTFTSTARAGRREAIAEETVVEGAVARDLYIDGTVFDLRGAVYRNCIRTG